MLSTNLTASGVYYDMSSEISDVDRLFTHCYYIKVNKVIINSYRASRL